MIFVAVLWIIAFSLLVYAVVSNKNGSELPPIPSDALVLSVVGTEFELCTPAPGADPNPPPNSSIIGNGLFLVVNVTEKVYRSINLNTNGSCRISQNPDLVTIQINTWQNSGGVGSYGLKSTTHTGQQLLDYYFKAPYVSAIEPAGSLGKPEASNVTSTTLTISSEDLITAGNALQYEFKYGLTDDPLEFTVEAVKEGSSITADVTGLTSNETYYFICFVSNPFYSGLASDYSEPITTSGP
jgi:hypothetical protein